MDRTAILGLIQAAGFGTDTQSVVAENAAIDATFLELSGEREWSWLRKQATAALTIGSATVPSPADLAYPKTLRLALATISLPSLTNADGTQILDWLHFDQGTGEPHSWSWVNNAIVVYPRPDKAYATELDYVKVPVVTGAAGFGGSDEVGQTPPFEIRFHTVIAWGAIRWLYIRRENAAMYQIASAEYVRARQQFEQGDRPPAQTSVAEWEGWGYIR